MYVCVATADPATTYGERRRRRRLGLLLISTENTAIVPASLATAEKRGAVPPPLFWPEDSIDDYQLDDMETQLPLPSSQIPTIFRPYIRKPPPPNIGTSLKILQKQQSFTLTLLIRFF